MSEELKNRTKAFALRVVDLVDEMPKHRSAHHFGGQLLRAATSVAANYRAACRGRSAAEFCSKLGIVEEEADESVFWLEMIDAKNFAPSEEIKILIQEGHELLAITVASIKTARTHKH